MAGGRRNVKSSSFNKHQAHASDDRHTELPTQPQVIPPKHIPIPEITTNSDLFFEVWSLMLSVFAMTGQYVNLYRSVNWLPSSHTEYIINFYLIDGHVLIFSLIMVGRRMPVCILKQICFLCLPTTYHASCLLCIYICTVIIFLPILIFCSYNIVITHGILSIPFLIYPFAIYLIVLGRKATKFLELIMPPQERLTGAKSKHSANSKQNSSLMHVCSMSAEVIREEVETLKNDFNVRWKQVLYNSFLIVYQTSFFPCYFSQAELHFDVSFAIQHGVLTCVTSFILYVIQCFPPKYCDVLHRAALHLGRWQKVEVKNVHVPYSIWTESTTWNQGALVKHSKELFKAEGISNAAEPGHLGHSRFYILFKDPTGPIRILFLIQILLVSALMVLLCQSYTWNELLPLELLIFINCKTLYFILKVFIVIKKIYHEEKVLIYKFCN